MIEAVTASAATTTPQTFTQPSTGPGPGYSQSGVVIGDRCGSENGCWLPAVDYLDANDLGGSAYVLVLDPNSAVFATGDFGVAWHTVRPVLPFAKVGDYSVWGKAEAQRDVEIRVPGTRVFVAPDGDGGFYFGDAWDVAVAITATERRTVVGSLSGSEGSVASAETGIRPFEIVTGSSFFNVELSEVRVTDALELTADESLWLPVGVGADIRFATQRYDPGLDHWVKVYGLEELVG